MVSLKLFRSWPFVALFLAACGGGGNSNDSSSGATAVPAPVSISIVVSGIDSLVAGDLLQVSGSTNSTGGLGTLSFAGNGVQNFNVQPTRGEQYILNLTAPTNHTCYFGGVAATTVGIVGMQNIALSVECSGPRGRAVKIAAGGSHSCIVDHSGRLWCWGAGGAGQLGGGVKTDKPTPILASIADDWATVAGGDAHTCATKTNGSLWCWGRNTSGQLGDGTKEDKSLPARAGEDNDWAIVSAGGDHSCATKTNGTLWCWGLNYNGQVGDTSNVDKLVPTQVGNASNWVAVTVGHTHTCGIRNTKTSRTLWCWGANDFGQLGFYSSGNKSIPYNVGNEMDWAAVTAGGSHTCAIKLDGTLWCWGSNDNGQLGDGTVNPNDVFFRGGRSTPGQIVGGANDWAVVTAGGNHTCATKISGTLWCWGRDSFGQLGDGSTVDKLVPTQVGVASDWALVAGGGSKQIGSVRASHTCGAKTNGSLLCWGDNAYGQVGTMAEGNKSVPSQVTDATNWVKVAGGGFHTCATKTDGALWCWGWNLAGQLGIGTAEAKSTPFQVDSANDWDVVSTGAAHTCATKVNGTLWCWGANGVGQLGDGTTVGKSIPTQVGNASDWVAVAGGSNTNFAGAHTCATKTDGTLWCWGENSFGQIGDDTTESKSAPVKVGEHNDWATVIAGAGYTCATKTDSTLWCWGAGFPGQLGDGKNGNSFVPNQVDGTSNWTAIAGSSQGWPGDAHICAIKANGTLWCWGSNRYGQLGNPTSGSYGIMPSQVGNDSDWIRVAVGFRNSCATKDNGTLWCWGSNILGADGNGAAFENTAVPTQMDSTGAWVTVASGGTFHSCATSTNGGLWCWGANDFGQLGDGSGFKPNPQPVP